jgi:hypothetical protein
VGETPPCHAQPFDWDSFFNAAGAQSPVLPDASRPGFTGSGFVRDFNTLNNGTTYDTFDPTTFTQGSKDTLNISSNWVCTPANNVTNKGDIQNAYAVSYTDPVTQQQFLYFGQERNSNAGDANVGFWFLQDNNANCPSGGGAWTGNHVDGDLFIVSAFTNGGTVSTITAFKWVGGASGHIDPTPVAGGGDCRASTQTAGDPICATANTTNITVPWLTDNNGKTTGLGHSLLTGEFFEGGINLTNTGLGNKCFNTFVGNTRSSQSLTATLFDFARGSLSICKTATQTTPVDAANHNNPPASSIPAAPADAQVSVQDKTVLTVSGVSSFNGSIDWHICGRTDPSSTQLCDGTTGNVGVDLGSTNVTAAGTYFSPTAQVTAAGRYCFRAEFSGDSSIDLPGASDSKANECFTVSPRTPTLTTTATAGVETGTALNDTAHLGNTAKEPGTGGPAGASPTGSINPTTLGGAAQGTITFTLFSVGASSHCGTAIATRTVNVSGNGDYNANDPSATGSGSLSPGPGTYFWTASYSGDLPNTLGQSTACDDANESSTVVDARISIAPNGVNEVNSNHTFTVTVTQNDGSGFVAASGATVTVTLTDAGGATAVPSGPLTGTTDANGQFTVTFTSATAGTVTGHASATLTVDGVALSRSTNGSSGNSGDVIKRFVDARITINPPVATNTVGDPHTFTVTVQQDDGLPANAPGGDAVTGFGPAPDGTSVAVTLVNSDGANFEIPFGGDTCNVIQVPPGAGTVGGVCTVTFSSQTAGTVTGNASVTFSVGGVSLTRDTDPATTAIPCGGGLVQGTNCGPAVKVFLAGSISWTKVDNANPARALAGATFALCRTATFNFTTKGFDDLITPDCSFGPVVDNTGQAGYTGVDKNPIGGQFSVTGLPLGRYTVQETVAPPGYVVDPNIRTVELSPNDPGPPPVNHTDQVITIPFVDGRPILKITGLSYTNAPTANLDQPDGIFVGDTTFTVNLHNYGTADAVLTNSSLVVSNAAPSTGLTCDNGGVLPISQTIAAGADNSPAITLSCHYDHPNGNVITGTLVVKYTTNGLERTASGSPATISFTVNPTN